MINNLENNVKKNSIIEIIMYVLLQFPISSILKVYIEPLNIILTGICFGLFFLYYIKYNIKRKEVILLGYIVIVFVQNILICGFKYYSINMLFYFPFLILYFCFFVREHANILNFMKNHKRYIDVILILWCCMIIISLFFSSSYIYEGETKGFVSFAGTTFLLCPISILIFALLAFQYCLYRKKIYMIALIVPSLCVLLGSTRTYLVVLMCAWMIFIYISMKKQRNFIPLMIFTGIIFVAIVFVSPIKNKFLETSNREEELNMDALEAFTSGRSVFWEYDLKHIFSNNILKVIFGNGVNYLFYLNKAKFHVALWAHNDFIQLLSDYGILGFIVYIYMFKYIIKEFFENNVNSKIIVVILILMWGFNAFFNMFYTYFCAILSFPIFLLCIKYDTDKRKALNKL